MKMTKWVSNEEITRDIQEISVFSNNEEVVLQNISPKRTLLGKSLFDDEYEPFFQNDDGRENDTEPLEYCKPVRGRPINNIPPIKKPGGSPSFLENQSVTSASIRKVCGFGFSNDLIEHNVHNIKNRPVSSTFYMPNIRLNSLSGSTKSGTNSPSTPRRYSPRRCASDPLKHEQEKVSIPFSSSAAKFKEIFNDAEGPTPPPLFDIIKGNKLNCKTPIQDNTAKNANNWNNNDCQVIQKTTRIDYSSKKENELKSKKVQEKQNGNGFHNQGQYYMDYICKNKKFKENGSNVDLLSDKEFPPLGS